MVLIAILSATALSRFASRSAFEEIGYSEEVAAAARYAQKLAISSGCPVAFELRAAGYVLHQPRQLENCGTAPVEGPVVDPSTGQSPYAGTTPDGVIVAAAESLPATRVFDAQGRIAPASDLVAHIGTRTLVVRSQGGAVTVQ